MPDSDAIVANANWEACEMCKHAVGNDGCLIGSDDFKYDQELNAFVCENYVYRAKDE